MRTFTALVRFSLPDRYDGTAADAKEFIYRSTQHGLLRYAPEENPVDLDEVEVVETTGKVVIPAVALLSELAEQREKIASMETLARGRGRR